MSFCFNWGRLDDTAAEALRLLINKKLENLLEEKLGAKKPGATKDTRHDASPPLDGGAEGLGNSSAVGALALTSPPAVGTIGADNASSAVLGASSTSAPPLPGIGGPATLAALGSGCAEGSLSSVSAPAGLPGAAGAAAAGTGSAAGSGALPPPLSAVASSTTSAGANRTKPLLEYVRVTSLEWGTAPPFVELVGISDALPLADPCAASTASPPGAGAALSQDSCHSTNAAALGGWATGRLQTPTLPAFAATGAGSEVPGDGSMRAGNGSPTKAPSRAARWSLGSPVAGAGLPADGADTINGAEFPSPAATGMSASSTTAVRDTLTPFLGPNGLFVRLHVTYGGSLRVSLGAAVQYDVNVIGPFVVLPVRMPLSLCLSELDLDCYLCCNLQHNACCIWLEPGRLSASPINRMKATAIFGEHRGSAPGSNNGAGGGSDSGGGGYAGSDVNAASVGDADHADSSVEYFSRYGSSVSGDDAEDDAVYVDEKQIELFLLHELKSLLKEKLVAPHFVRVPVVLGE